MSFPEMVVAIVCISTGAGVLSQWIKHRSHVAELKLQSRNNNIQGADANLRSELEALRQEVRQLRDTTLQYDLSFDTALQNMERRVGQVERKVNASSNPTTSNIEQPLGF